MIIIIKFNTFSVLQMTFYHAVELVNSDRQRIVNLSKHKQIIIFFFKLKALYL